MDRNYVKRITREAFRKYQGRLPLEDYLVYFHSPVHGGNSSRMTEMLHQTFDQIIADLGKGAK